MLNDLLDWVARTYFSFYCHFMQRPKDQPYTAQADRINRRWPAFTIGTALLILWLTAQFRGWALSITFMVYLFALWWFPHIMSYQRKHPENEPYKINKLLAWAVKRMG